MQSRRPFSAAAVSKPNGPLRINATDNRISYAGPWAKLDQVENINENPIESDAPRETNVASFYFTGSSLAIHALGTKHDAVFMVNGRPELCIPHISLDRSLTRVDCTPPLSSRPHHFRMEVFASSFFVSHFEVYSAYPIIAQTSTTDSVLRRFQQHARQLIGRAEPSSSLSSGTRSSSLPAPSASGVSSLPPANICTSPSGCVVGICPDPVQCPQDYSTTSIYATVSGGDGFPGGVVSGAMTSTSTSTLSTTLSTPDFTFTLPSASASTTAIPNTLSTDSAHVLSDGAIAAIAVCSTLGVAIIVSLLWLARRGTFGSGRLFGVGLGAARYATTWRGAAGRGAGGGDKGAGAVPVLPGEAGYVVTPFVSPPESTVGDAMGLDSAVAVSPTTPSSRSLTEFATPLMASASHFGGSSTYTDFTPPGLARAPSTYKSPPLSSAVVGSAPAVSLPQLDVSQLPSVHTPVAPHTYSDLEHNADEAEALWPQARARRQSQDGGIRLEGGPLDLHEVLPPAYDG